MMNGLLSDEQRKLVEANRQKTLERLGRKKKPKQSQPEEVVSESSSNKRPINQIIDTPVQSKSKFVEYDQDGSIKRPKVLTQEQKQKIEQNRLKAIEIQKRLRDKELGIETPPKPQDYIKDIVRLNKNEPDPETKQRFIPPPINRKDYIDYDFATMQDSKGGFLPDEIKQVDEENFQEWQDKQKELQKFKEAPPPMDLNQLPKCFECQSVDIDLNLYHNFNKVKACRKCIKEKPDKYSLLTKTECKEDYLLTEPELKDLSILPRIEKPNPHGYSKMQLFLRFQVEEFAWKKWGGPNELDQEYERRELNKLKRKEKKYQDSLKEMRKKTRAEEFTRKMRGDGKSIGEKHVHDWSAPINISDNIIKRRCIDCGIETEEFVIM
ncbi:unnamed protein product [Candida verbasci]|uniref:XPA C-terminal domain-containing protein n=1 Tax=Candida verbasci TaxID=1227364 RepID=A0A9W4XC94_9ASCO|nr:unnamed protein product [Candida verbasci]